MRSEGEARPLAGLIVIGRSGPKLLQLNEGVSRSDWTTLTRRVDLPDDTTARFYIALWVDGGGGTAWFDDVSVTPPKTVPVSAMTNAGPYDAWNPPLGEAVQNLALTEGWTDARLVAAFHASVARGWAEGDPRAIS